MIRQTVLPFKIEKTQDTITPHGGLSLLGEFAIGGGILKYIDKYLPKPGSGAGYKPSEYIFPMLLMLHGGGREVARRDGSLKWQGGTVLDLPFF